MVNQLLLSAALERLQDATIKEAAGPNIKNISKAVQTTNDDNTIALGNMLRTHSPLQYALNPFNPGNVLWDTTARLRRHGLIPSALKSQKGLDQDAIARHVSRSEFPADELQQYGSPSSGSPAADRSAYLLQALRNRLVNNPGEPIDYAATEVENAPIDPKLRAMSKTKVPKFRINVPSKISPDRSEMTDTILNQLKQQNQTIRDLGKLEKARPYMQRNPDEPLSYAIKAV